MGSLLSSYLSSHGKPVICNGKLLRYGNKKVLARESANYSVIFTVPTSGLAGDEINLTTGDNLPNGEWGKFTPITEPTVISSVLDFDRKYARAWGKYPEDVDASHITIGCDGFTRAIVIESRYYSAMMNPQVFHSTDRIYSEEERKIRAELLLEYINNYYEIYTHLLNRRIMSSRMPFVVKGHLVAGLFQPLLCSTPLIRSPLEYPIVSDFLSLIHGDAAGISDELGNIEELLEVPDAIGKGIRLSCVSMHDIVRRFAPAQPNTSAGLVIPRLMNRGTFMFIMLYLLSGIVNRGVNLPVPLDQKHRARMEEITRDEVYSAFANNLITGYQEMATRVATI
mgnify:CR=1 FL=1